MNERPRSIRILLTVVVWITAVLLADVGAGPELQARLGILTWALLLLLLRGESVQVRFQVIAAVGFATLMEVTGSILLDAYTYRLENIPGYVPPGHGLIYLAAVAGARLEILKRSVQPLRWAAVMLCGGWTAWGLLYSPRMDVLGGLLFLVFAGCLFTGRSPVVYALAFAITTQLELMGTMFGNWTWASHAGLLSAGNPPSAVAAGYCVIDSVALSVGSLLFRWVHGFHGDELRENKEIRRLLVLQRELFGLLKLKTLVSLFTLRASPWKPKVVSPKRGFTLIEILVVLAILGIGYALVAPRLLEPADSTAELQRVIEAARRSALTAAQSRVLLVDADGNYELRQADGEAIARGELKEKSVVAVRLRVSALGACLLESNTPAVSIDLRCQLRSVQP
jgi:prepilin-type N-terminal cleavage/methylation domain-containing protein